MIQYKPVNNVFVPGVITGPYQEGSGAGCAGANVSATHPLLFGPLHEAAFQVRHLNGLRSTKCYQPVYNVL